jgi:integrase
MGVFARPDSPYWWLWLETAPPGHQREKTAIRIGTTTKSRRDSQRLAEQLYAQRITELATKIHRLPASTPSIRFSAYAMTYQTDVIAHHRGAGRERELLKELIAFFGTDAAAAQTKDVLLTQIDQELVRHYLTRRVARVVAATANREVDLLKAMLRDAVPKYLTASPLAGMRRLQGTKPKRRLLSEAEERRLLKAAKKDRQDYALLVVGMDTLVRLGDLVDLRRVDRHGPWIYIADPKSNAPYEVPLSPRAVKALDAIPGTSDFYFSKFRRAENPRDWRSSVRQRLRRLCAAAKVPFGKSARGITFHWATRRTGATRLLVQQRQPLPVVQQLGNWKKPDTLLEIYTEAQRDDLLRAVGQRVSRSRTTPAERRKRA